jgi:hypothetical protein
MMMYSGAYPTLERAIKGAENGHEAHRLGIYRIYKRLDGQYEIRSNLRVFVPAQWELIRVAELNAARTAWITIIP